MAASREAIERILKDLRNGINNRRFTLIPRRKNLRTLARLGITWADARDEIRSLQASDYVSGPSPDYDFPGSDDLWVFKKQVLGQTIYIKFKIEYQNNNDVKAISFHIDETI